MSHVIAGAESKRHPPFLLDHLPAQPPDLKGSKRLRFSAAVRR